MAFTREDDLTKDRIGAFIIILRAADPLNPQDVNSGRLHPDIVMSDGSIQNKPIDDLLERLQDDAEGQQHLANLIDFRNYVRARLVAQVLPTP